MKHSKMSKVMALVLCVMMLLSVVPMIAFASIANWDTENVVFEGTSFGTNGYYNVISKKDYTLVPGAATETEMVLNNSARNRRQVMHIIELDPSNPDVSVVPGYYNIDKDLSDYNNWKAAGVTDVAKYYEDELGYKVVGAMNTALAYDNNAPYSYLVYNGQVLVDAKGGVNNFHSGACQTMLCVYKDEVTGECTCELRTHAQGLRGDEWQAIGANFAMIVNNGVLVSKTEERTSESAARSMVGVKEDGTLVLVMNDGRNANNSKGFNNYELGESMLALGCKWAFNCDGGGSSSFVTRRAGEDDLVCRCVPCDGAERPTLNSVIIVSNVAATGILDTVNISAEYDYFAPGTTYTFDATALDTHGYAMDMPADATWSLSDASFGTVANGTFISNGTLGDVDVQVESGGAVVGTKTIHIANPTDLKLSATETTLPYSTAEKVRTTNLPMVAKIGENDVYTAGAYNISVDPVNAGTVDGLTFTAIDDTSIASAVVSITYIPTNESFTYTVHYGKGSEVVWDFEDGDISDWVGTAEADQMMRDHGAPLTTFGDWSTPFRTLTSGGQISWSNTTTTALSSVAEGGKAHSGDKALAVTFNMKNVEFNSWVYSIIWNMQGNLVLRDVANGNNATAFGCWVYIPKGFYTAKNNGAQALQLTVQKGPDADHLSGTQLNLQYNGKNINALKEADIPENRWVYVKADLTQNNYVKLVDPYNDVYRSPSFIRMYVKPSEAQEMTYYFDDWTLDYSSAVDDREPPVISNATYCTNDTNIEFNNQTIDANIVSFDANIADTVASNAEGLDYTSAKIYVDGVAVSGVKASGNTMGVQNVTLSNGVHSIKFEIADKLGNSTTLTKTLTVDSTAAKSAVRLAGHNDLNNTIEAGSVYYVDVVADAIEDISAVTATIELQSAHEWELDHMIVADGFEASYELNSIKDNIATVTITKTGNVTLTGEQTLVSMPARVWSFDESTSVGGDGTAPSHMTAAQRYATSYGEPVLLMEANVLYGEVEYVGGAAGTFGGSISEATAVTGNKTKVWHEHNAEPLEDVPATCTTDGYSGRTYCEKCGSVVDWGTTLPATGHHYELKDGKFVCDCGDVYDPGTGLFEMNGKNYYAINGVLQQGWVYDTDTYYFGNDFAGLDGEQSVSHRLYTFENGKLIKGAWVLDDSGYRYYWAEKYYMNQWVVIDGETYRFDGTAHALTGYQPVPEGKNRSLYHFSDTGALIETIEKDNGIYFADDGNAYYFKDGYLYVAGLVKYNNYYYYFGGSYVAMRNGSRYIDAAGAHGYIDPGTYSFDDACHLILPEKNGVIDDYLYINGVIQKAYKVVEYEGDFYYVYNGNKIARDKSFYFAESELEGTGLVAGYYDIDSDGKMIVKNGVYNDYLYINGVIQKAYKVVEYGGDFYYVYNGNKIAKDKTYYFAESELEGTGLVAGYYDIDSDGKMIVKNGVYNDYLYINGVIQKAYKVVKYGGDFYYVYNGNKIAKDKTYYFAESVLEGTGLVAGYYDIDSDGKMSKK